MNFQPYHRFQDCDNLENAIQEKINNNNISDQALRGYYIYHFSLLHKLRSANEYVESLKEYLSRQDTVEEEPEEVTYKVNFHFDGFTYSIGSALDIFSREVLCYLGISLPNNVYFTTAREEILNSRGNNSLTNRLSDPGWLQEFRDYRNTATHENIVGNTYTIENQYHGGESHRRLLYPLPDNPRDRPTNRTYQNNPDIVEYCKSTFERALRLIHPVYTDLCNRIEQNNRLPV